MPYIELSKEEKRALIEKFILEQLQSQCFEDDFSRRNRYILSEELSKTIVDKIATNDNNEDSILSLKEVLDASTVILSKIKGKIRDKNNSEDLEAIISSNDLGIIGIILQISMHEKKYYTLSIDAIIVMSEICDESFRRDYINHIDLSNKMLKIFKYIFPKKEDYVAYMEKTMVKVSDMAILLSKSVGVWALLNNGIDINKFDQLIGEEGKILINQMITAAVEKNLGIMKIIINQDADRIYRS